MEFSKAHFDVDGQNVRFSVPIQKVDQEHRMVSGFATLDNIDRQGDVVSTAASLDAFNSFRGNLREMHQSIAVGKVVSFSTEELYDPISNKMYTGIYVNAYISRGAQDTWEKVLDGTLSGFSIGGNILEADKGFDPSTGNPIRIITKYELIELSVVDSPANQLANIFAITKADGVATIKGMAADIVAETVFWCKEHQIAVIKEADALDCAVCSKPMANIGWVEQNDAQKSETIGDLVKMYKGDLVENLGEGGNQMQEEIDVTAEAEAAVEKSDAVVEEAAVVEEVADEAAEEVAEKAAEVDEVVSEEPDLVKMIQEIGDYVKNVEAGSTAHAEELAGLAKAVSENSAEFSASIADIAAKHAELAETVAGLSAALEGITTKVDAIDKADAVKKSVDLGRSTEVTNNNSSFWAGSLTPRG